MAVRGQKPKPAVQKKLEGNPGKRKIDDLLEFEPCKSMAPPAFLDAIAKSEWRRVAKYLISKGVLTAPDRTALVLYCSCWSQLVESTKIIHKEGLIVSVRGETKAHPAARMRFNAITQLRQLCIEFGMTPSARGRIQIPGDVKDDDDSWLGLD
jgi:P27 family predicted phage terminase small subunit